MFSLAPVFQQEVHGGSQRILTAIARFLGEREHEVTVLCTSRPDLPREFKLSDQVTVKPILNFKPLYPEPYYTAPYNLANIVTTLSLEILAHDRLYIHDSELAYHFVYSQIPTVCSFRDFVYPDTLACGLSFQRDRLILSSNYLEQCVVGTMGRYFPTIGSRISVIPNGIDLDQFRPSKKRHPPFHLGLKENAFVMLCPHRPDPRKGLEDCVRLLARIASHSALKGRPPYLLVPRWVDSRIAESQEHYYQDSYRQLAQLATDMGVGDKLIVHPWMNADEMANYYSFGDVTLCLGGFVEAFGNVSIESVACGCPAVTSAVAAHRGKLRKPFIFEVPPFDVDSAFQAVLNCLESPFDISEARRELGQRYPMNKMLSAYASEIERATVTEPIPLRVCRPAALETVLQKPAWCAVFGDRIYNDYAYSYTADPDIIRAYEHLPTSCRRLTARGFTAALISDWIASGFLTYREP